MKRRWLVGMVTAALAAAGLGQATAQQTAPGMRVPTFVGSRAGPFAGAPTFRGAAVGSAFPTFRGRAFFPDIRSPASVGINPLGSNPLIADIRSPLSGTINPAAGVPFGATGAGLLPAEAFPLFGTLSGAGVTALQPTPFGVDPRTSLSFGFNPGVASSVAPDARRSLSGAFTSLSAGFNPSIASPFIANTRQPQSGRFSPAATATRAAAAGARTPATRGSFATGIVSGDASAFGATGAFAAPSVGSTPAVAGRALTAAARRLPAPSLQARELRSLAAAQRLMARVPLTEGTVVSTGTRGIQVRVGTQLRRFAPGQTFFFTGQGEMRNAAVESRRLARGARVLVPATPVASGQP